MSRVCLLLIAALLPLISRAEVRLVELIQDQQHSLGPGDYRRYVDVDGRKRFYDIHIPPSYSPEKAPPLILAFHGGGANPESFREWSTLDSLSDQKGFIVVYPAGYHRLFSNRFLTWNCKICCGAALKFKTDDVKFTAKILDDLKSIAHYDPKRVYATGISNGALMSYLLASELSNRIAAIAPVAGHLSLKHLRLPERPVPILHFHGKLDNNATFFGGVGSNAISKVDWEPVLTVIESWAKGYGCRGKLKTRATVGKADLEFFEGCPANVAVGIWTIEDGGHTWPGGKEAPIHNRLKLGHTNRDISAAEEMWRFFQRFSL